MMRVVGLKMMVQLSKREVGSFLQYTNNADDSLHSKLSATS